MKTSYKVLFLRTGNSVRPIMPETIVNRKGVPTRWAYGTGSHPFGKVRSEALRQIEAAGLHAAGARSKSWDEISVPGAPHLDFAFTVCNNAAREVCPIWPGQPMTTHLGGA